MDTLTKLYTVAEFEELLAQPENADRKLELIDGEIVEKVTTEVHGMIAAKITARLLIYDEINQLGGRTVVEVHHRAPSDDQNARIPDVAYTTAQRLLLPTEKGSVPQMPDLAVEVKSPTDSYKNTREKAHYYLQHGVKLVWLVYPEKKFVEVYTPDDQDVLMIEDTLDGGAVLPGFQLAVKDIFNMK